MINSKVGIGTGFVVEDIIDCDNKDCNYEVISADEKVVANYCNIDCAITTENFISRIFLKLQRYKRLKSGRIIMSAPKRGGLSRSSVRRAVKSVRKKYRNE